MSVNCGGANPPRSRVSPDKRDVRLNESVRTGAIPVRARPPPPPVGGPSGARLPGLSGLGWRQNPRRSPSLVGLMILQGNNYQRSYKYNTTRQNKVRASTIVKTIALLVIITNLTVGVTTGS